MGKKIEVRDTKVPPTVSESRIQVQTRSALALHHPLTTRKISFRKNFPESRKTRINKKMFVSTP